MDRGVLIVIRTSEDESDVGSHSTPRRNEHDQAEKDRHSGYLQAHEALAEDKVPPMTMSAGYCDTTTTLVDVAGYCKRLQWPRAASRLRQDHCVHEDDHRLLEGPIVEGRCDPDRPKPSSRLAPQTSGWPRHT